MSEPQDTENEPTPAAGAVETAPPEDAADASTEAEAPPVDADAESAVPSADVDADGDADTAANDSADQSSFDELLKQASFEEPAVVEAGAGADTSSFNLPDFQQAMRDAQVSSIDLLRDVDLNVKIELGRSRMLVEDVLKLAEGSVVELDKLAGDPVDVYVNDRLVARGEVLVLNDNFCVRINEIVAGVKEEGT
jgi:flagellar motor switch protein FliN/FliY